MVVAPPPDFNLLLSTDKILELEPSLRNSKLFRALSIDTSRYSFDSDGTEEQDSNKFDTTKALVVSEEDQTSDGVIDKNNGCKISDNDSSEIADINSPPSLSIKGNSIKQQQQQQQDGNDREFLINNDGDKSETNDTVPIRNTPTVVDSKTIRKENPDLFKHNSSTKPPKPTTTKIQTSKSHSSLLQQSSPFNQMKPFHYNPIVPALDRDNQDNGGDSDFSSEESLQSVSRRHRQEYNKQPMSEVESAYDFELKRRSVGSTLSEFAMHSNHDMRESKFLSKSLTNLSFQQQHGKTHLHQLSTPVRTRKKISDLFSNKTSSIQGAPTSRNSLIYGSASNLANIMMDIDMGEKLQGDNNKENKSRTSSVFRRFSLKKGGDETTLQQQQTFLNIPQVNIQDENSVCIPLQQQQQTDSKPSSSKNGGGILRNLSFKSNNNNNNNNNVKSPTEEISEVISALKTTSSQGGRTFPVIRSPFSRAKFDKEISAEERKRLYSEMLKSIRDDDCRRFKLLLKRRRVAVNSFEHDTSLIHEAAFKGCEKCVKLLMKGGWCVDLQDDAGWRPLHAAAFGRSLDAVKCLVAKGADPNVLTKAGLSPLHLAVYNNDLYTTHELFQHGADPLVESRSAMVDEGTPFQLAINLKNTLVLDYFLLQSTFLV